MIMKQPTGYGHRRHEWLEHIATGGSSKPSPECRAAAIACKKLGLTQDLIGSIDHEKHGESLTESGYRCLMEWCAWVDSDLICREEALKWLADNPPPPPPPPIEPEVF